MCDVKINTEMNVVNQVFLSEKLHHTVHMTGSECAAWQLSVSVYFCVWISMIIVSFVSLVIFLSVCVCKCICVRPARERLAV